MLLLRAFIIGTAGVRLVHAACLADNCFSFYSSTGAEDSLVSSFCRTYLHSTPGTVTISETSQTITATPPAKTTTVSATVTTSVTKQVVCTVTKTGPSSTYVFYPTRTAVQLQARDVDAASNTSTSSVTIPPGFTLGCTGDANARSSSVSSACRCRLTSKTVGPLVTHTTTVAGKTPTVTITNTQTVTSTTTQCGSSTSTKTVSAPFSCGVATPSQTRSGYISCSAPAGASATAAKLRIEGGTEGTIFEGCIASTPRNITTPSGGTHPCNGLNNHANFAPGATCTTELDEAAAKAGFQYDGTYSNQFQDYLITSIDKTSQTQNQSWSLLLDRKFTTLGGCQQKISPFSTTGPGSQEVLWAFDALNAETILHISPDFKVVSRNDPLQVPVNVTDQNGAPVAGASIRGGGTSDANGTTFVYNLKEPGCYQFKATKAGATRSNAFYLAVI